MSNCSRADLFDATACRSASCHRLPQWLPQAIYEEHAPPWRGVRDSSCGRTTQTSTIALLLRGRLPPAFHLSDVLKNYRDNIVCPFASLGHAVEAHLTVYDADEPRLTDEILNLLAAPSLVHSVPLANSSQVLNFVAAVYLFHRHTARVTTTYSWLLLTRLDLRLKQHIVQLPGLSNALANTAAPHKFLFLFQEASDQWRKNRVKGVCFYWVHGHAVSDIMHALRVELLDCLRSALMHYLLRTPLLRNTNLHHLYDSLRQFVPTSSIGFMQPGCYNSNPQGGLRNPVYDIAPRHLCYDTSICSSPNDFTIGAPNDGPCCATPQYCCPHSKRTCAGPPAPPQPKCRIKLSDGLIRPLV